MTEAAGNLVFLAFITLDAEKNQNSERMKDLMYRFLLLTMHASLLASCMPTATVTPSQTPSPSGPCDLSFVNPVAIYNRASAAADVFGTVGPGETFQPSAKTADGFYGFEPGDAQAGNVGLFRLRWVLKTIDVTTSTGCTNLPTVVAPIAGICYAMMIEDTPIFSSPDTTSALVTTMHMNDYAMITAHNPGWFTLDLNVASTSLDSLGYSEESKLGGFNGPCSF